VSCRTLYLLTAVAVLATAPAVAGAQQPVTPQAGPATASAQGPRLAPELHSYQPTVRQKDAPPVHATAAAADNTVITISTVGLVIIGIILLLLLA
jgi:hypothetical protein